MTVRKTALGSYAILLKDLRSLQVKVEYPKLIRKLQVDLPEAGARTLRALVAEASEDRRKAALIKGQAEANRRRIQEEWDKANGVWMIQGRKAISELKKKKEWDGSVYTADVERWVLANIPESQTLHHKLFAAEEIYSAAKALYNAYETRLSALQTYGRLIEKRLEIVTDDLSEIRKERRKAEAIEGIGGEEE